MKTSPFVKRILALFKKTQEKPETPQYPSDLLQQYKVTKRTLGVGSFAVVKECIHRTSGQPFALKIILKKAIAGKEHMLDSELDILKQVRHPNIVSMHGLYESKDAVYIVTDLAGGGELFQQLLNKGNYTEKDAAQLVRQILEGLAYLHEHDIVHRDLKPENLLFHTPADNANLMITDFGLSKILKNHDDILTTACGTPGYVAPEVLKQKGYGKPVDLWSVGVIMFTLLSGYTPFWGEDQATLFECILSGRYEFDDAYWSEISPAAKNLVDRLLTYNPSQRITAEEALQHRWIRNATGKETRPTMNLAPHVRRGLSSQQSIRSVMTTLTAFNHWDHEPETSDSSDTGKKTQRKKPSNKSKKGRVSMIIHSLRVHSPEKDGVRIL